MKALALELNTKQKIVKFLRWGKLISITGTAQVAVQALSFVSGILVIRLLPTQEYAMYTLANTMLGTMVQLADGGISTGVMSEGGKVWQNKEKLGSVLATGLDLRKKFAVASLIVAIPALIYLLLHHNASILVSILITLSIIPAFFTSLSGTLLEIIPKLHQDIIPLQKIQVKSSTARLALLCISLFVFPWAYIAVLAAGIPQIWSNRQLRNKSTEYGDLSQKSDPEIRKRILASVKRILPDSIYYCVWCQCAVWIISLYGSTEAVAQLGALGRLAVALSLVTILFGSLILPRFARLQISQELLLKRFLQIEAGLFGLSICIIGGIYLFSSQILWVLGNKYTGLDMELTLMMVGKCLSLIAGSTFLLCTSKGWVINPVLSIPIGILSIVSGIALINITTLRGIFILDIYAAIIQVVMHVSYFFYRNHRKTPNSDLD